MITENLSTLKIHKLTQAQYERERDAGKLDENALYLTPDEEDTSDNSIHYCTDTHIYDIPDDLPEGATLIGAYSWTHGSEHTYFPFSTPKVNDFFVTASKFMCRVTNVYTAESSGVLMDNVEFEIVANLNGGNSDTLDGKHADEFAAASVVEELQSKVGDSPVSEQITEALESYAPSIQDQLTTTGYKPLFAQTISVRSVGTEKRLRPEFEFVEGKKYKVVIDGVPYEQVAYLDPEDDMYLCLGALYDYDAEDYDYSVYPFVMYTDLSTTGTGRIQIAHGSLTEYSIEIYVEDEIEEKIDSKYIHTPSWSANKDEDGYIANRTHYSEIIENSVLFDGMVSTCNTSSTTNTPYELPLTSSVELGKIYRVVFDGICYVATAYEDENGGGETVIGAPYIESSNKHNFSDYPFTIDGDNNRIYCEEDGLHTIRISEIEEVVHKLDAKYLPDDISGMPPVSISDNGKFLRVVDGSWAAVALSNAEDGEF